jgi:hypothetical protein
MWDETLTDDLPIGLLAFVKHLRKIGVQWNDTLAYIEMKKA